MKYCSLARTAVLVVSTAIAAPVVAQDLPETSVNVIGYFSTLAQTQKVEKPFWTERIPTESNSKVSVDYNNMDVLGVNDFSILRMTEMGVTDFAASDISKMAGDNPVFEGCDLAGITSDIETARKACEAWRPVMDEAMREGFNTKLMVLAPNPPIVFWCRDEVAGLNDLQGKKVRVFNKTQSDFVSAVGGETVTMAFPEVVPALQRGVVDCGLTGSLSGNTAGWPEVSTHLFPLAVGWSISFIGANQDQWNSYSPELQAFFTEQLAELEEQLWTIGAQATSEGEACNTGEGECTLGKPGSMTLVAITDEDTARKTQLLQEVVLLEWGQRCGKECAQKWNETVGQVVGLEIPLDQL